MSTEYLGVIAELLATTNPTQAHKFRSLISTQDALYHTRASRFFSQYERLLKHLGKDFGYAVQCYNRLVSEMQQERQAFLRTGRYSNQSFDDVRKRLYENPCAFDYHMHGLALAQFIWWDQYQRFAFFSDNLGRYGGKIRRYLEIGAGHGLYTSEALRQIDRESEFDVVDVSPTSIAMSSVALQDDRVKYRLGDICEHPLDGLYDFITIGEVIEHLEDPGRLMSKLRSVLRDDAVMYITTPANAPMIDHIYLFNNSEEIRSFLVSCGFKIIQERAVFADSVQEKQGVKYKIPLMFAAFVGKA